MMGWFPFDAITIILLGSCLRFKRRGDFGEENLEGCTLVRHARDQDGAAALPDNSVDGGESEPRSLALFLGCEERFKHTSLGLGIHSVAGVLHRENDIGAGGHGVGRAGAGFFELYIPGFQDKLSTPRAWHREH